MAYDLVIKGGTIVTASDTFVADIAVEKGRVAAVGSALGGGNDIVDARGLVVVPGGVDAHTHFDMPFAGGTTADDFASGSLGAVFGGTTTIIDFAAQEKGQALAEALDLWRGKAEGRCVVDYSFHMGIVDLPEGRLKEMDRLVAEGVSSFKLYMAYPGRLMSDDATILRALLRSRENGGLICVHAENGGLIEVLVRRALSEGKTEVKYHALTRPASGEAEATRRAIALSEAAQAPVYIVHLSAAQALEEVRRARERGLPVLAETCPQYLYLNSDEYERAGFEGAQYVMSPPLRPRGNEKALWRGLADGTLSVVATDHCSFRMKSAPGKPGKDLGRGDFSKIPGGAPGVETRMLLLWDAVQKGKLTASRFVELCATAPAKLFGLYPRKGHLSPGADADIVLIDPKKRHVISAQSHHVNVDYNPYEGMTVHGAIRDVFVRGTHMVSGDRFVGKPGHGKFLRRTPRQFD